MLPSLNSEYPISPAQTEEFQKNGHIFLPHVCSPEEIAEYAPVITKIAAHFAGKQKPMEERDTFGKAFTLVGGIWFRDEDMERFTTAHRFAKIAADLMGVDGIRLYHDVAINKEAGGGYTPWHQDQYYWPMNTPHTVTMWMPLVDISVEMGALTFASGSHKEGYLGDQHISDTSHEYFDQLVVERGFPTVRREMKAGDATFHAGWTLHSAPGNQSDRARQVITVVFYADGCFTYNPMGNPHREGDFAAYMPGVQPGELAVSPLNPLLYSREKSR
jgi:ectoine hydroxylase-related dioxygenase (phytanoyl-CoA dioxygenase family)